MMRILVVLSIIAEVISGGSIPDYFPHAVYSLVMGGDDANASIPVSLNIANDFTTTDAKSCEKAYIKNKLLTISSIEECVNATSNMVVVHLVNSTDLPFGCNYFGHPLLSDGLSVFFNENNETKKYCKPELAVCICEVHTRRGIEVGKSFLLLMASVLGSLVILSCLIWVFCVRKTKYERNREKKLRDAMVEQTGVGGFATYLAMKPFGSDGASLSWRFGETEWDYLERERRSTASIVPKRYYKDPIDTAGGMDSSSSNNNNNNKPNNTDIDDDMDFNKNEDNSEIGASYRALNADPMDV
eukprot:TRINITY_DN7841_c0_g3_i1.p1 TRINITY_DN7841_c0_g3~~TRINITY_DN7841_c0_g3_i1.p1  ORF type:complete len:300 (+),score=49.12 TRINITY_DN7841_c0_g3_i1:55-954(+)